MGKFGDLRVRSKRDEFAWGRTHLRATLGGIVINGASAPAPGAFPKDQIAVIEKQIDRLRKEVDDRMSSNHTLWRAGLAGMGALILFKENLDLSRFAVLLPILAMGLGAHWLNQLLTLYRSGDAMAACEMRINALAGAVMLDHESALAEMRQKLLREWRGPFILAAVVSTFVYWFSIYLAYPDKEGTAGLAFWQIAVATAALANLVTAINLCRFMLYSWPGLRSGSAGTR